MGSEESGSVNERFRRIRYIDEHPVPFDQDAIKERWSRVPHKADEEPPSVDEAHDKYVHTIARWGDWHVFRPLYPFGHGEVVFWDGATGESFKIKDDEGFWHVFVNLLAEIVENEGDCREADVSSSLMPSGCYDQRCKSCGGSWMVG